MLISIINGTKLVALPGLTENFIADLLHKFTVLCLHFTAALLTYVYSSDKDIHTFMNVQIYSNDICILVYN